MVSNAKLGSARAGSCKAKSARLAQLKPVSGGKPKRKPKKQKRVGYMPSCGAIRR